MKRKVLVVDNHPAMLKFMANLLKENGHQVMTAEDGLTALSILATYIPDIIFIDLIMPKIDGEKLCRIIRSMQKLKHVHVTILSGIAAEEEIKFEPQDSLLIYSDGITEAMNPPSEEYGEDRFIQLVSQNRSLSAQAMTDAIIKDVRRFADEHPQSDDMTMVVIKRLG